MLGDLGVITIFGGTICWGDLGIFAIIWGDLNVGGTLGYLQFYGGT